MPDRRSCNGHPARNVRDLRNRDVAQGFDEQRIVLPRPQPQTRKRVCGREACAHAGIEFDRHAQDLRANLDRIPLADGQARVFGVIRIALAADHRGDPLEPRYVGQQVPSRGGVHHLLTARFE